MSAPTVFPGLIGTRSIGTVAARSRLVELPAGATVEDLLHGCPRKLVFTNREQRRCSQRRDLTGWGGRLAAKLAACDLLGITDAPAALAAGRDPGLTGLEVLPSRDGLCEEPTRCVLPHRPELTLGPAFAHHLRDGERLRSPSATPGRRRSHSSCGSRHVRTGISR